MKTEVNRLIYNKQFYLSLGCLLIIVFLAVLTSAENFSNDSSLYGNIYKNSPDSLSLFSAHNYWIGLSISNVFSTLYYFIFPLIISISLVDGIFTDLSSGNINYSLTRTSSFLYYSKKLLFINLIAFIMFVVPLVLGLLIFNLFSGQWDYSSYSTAYVKLQNGTADLIDDVFVGDVKSLFSSLLEKSPYLYILNYYIIGGLYAGIFISLGLATSFFIKNRYIIIFMPQILYMAWWFICTFLGKLSWAPFNFLDPKQPVSNLTYEPIIYVYILLLLSTLTLYIMGVKKHSDVL